MAAGLFSPQSQALFRREAFPQASLFSCPLPCSSRRRQMKNQKGQTSLPHGYGSGKKERKILLPFNFILFSTAQRRLFPPFPPRFSFSIPGSIEAVKAPVLSGNAATSAQRWRGRGKTVRRRKRPCSSPAGCSLHKGERFSLLLITPPIFFRFSSDSDRQTFRLLEEECQLQRISPARRWRAVPFHLSDHPGLRYISDSRA